MGTFSEQQKNRAEANERDKTRRENIAKYYLDLSKLTFTALVLGSLTFIITGDDVDYWAMTFVMAGWIASTVILAKIGNQIFK